MGEQQRRSREKSGQSCFVRKCCVCEREMGDVVNLDPGVRFVPTDEEVVMEYLVKAAMGEALPGNYVIERDLYADKAPWEILMTTANNHEEGQGQGGDVHHHLPWMTIRSRDDNSGRIKKESTIYVLTALKKVSRSGNRIGRRAGCGGWHGENGNKIVEVETGRVIGYKRMFTFEVQDESISTDIEMGLMIQHHWIMHEYTLDYDAPTTTCDFAIRKLTVDDSKNVKIAPKSRMRRNKTAPQPHLCSRGGSSGQVHDNDSHVVGAMASINIQAATEEVVYEKIHNEDNEYHSSSRKRMRCAEMQADEEGNNPQRRKKMPPLELAEDHHIRQQPTAITDDDGNVLLMLVQEEPTTDFGVDFDFEVDQFLYPVMWPATSEPDDDRFTLPLEEEERRLQEETNQALSCTIAPYNLDSGSPPPPDAALLQEPTSTSKSTSFPINFTYFPHVNESDNDHFNTEAAAAVVKDQHECSMTMVNSSGAELRNGSLDLDVEKEPAVPTPTINYVDDVPGQCTWVPLPQQLPAVLQEEESSEIYFGDLWSY